MYATFGEYIVDFRIPSYKIPSIPHRYARVIDLISSSAVSE